MAAATQTYTTHKWHDREKNITHDFKHKSHCLGYVSFVLIGVRVHFFLEGLSHFCPKIFFDSAQKTVMLTCKITLPDSPHPVIIVSKNLGFRALYLAWRNEIDLFPFTKYCTNNIFFIFGCWLLPEKYSFCPKNNGFARVRGAAAPQPSDSYAIMFVLSLQ